MGAKCCSDRKGVTTDQRHADHKERKSFVNNGYDRKRGLSIGYALKGDDAEKFDRAFESNDLNAFVGLLSSKQPIEKFDERMHPWAEDPTTVGALAGTQLAVLASADDPGIKEAIGEAGAIPALVEFVKSDQVDRVQTAVVALSFLTGDCPGNSVAAYEAGVMPLLLKHLNSPVSGMRAAAATALRNICMEREEYRIEFAGSGGIEAFVDLLDHKPDLAGTSVSDAQLEMVLNLQDILESDDGTVHPDHAAKAMKAGAKEKLTHLLDVEDGEVKASSRELLAALEEGFNSGGAGGSPAGEAGGAGGESAGSCGGGGGKDVGGGGREREEG